MLKLIALTLLLACVAGVAGCHASADADKSGVDVNVAPNH